MSHCKWPYS